MRRWVGLLPTSAEVLDLGCGHGFEVERMLDLGLRPVGVDLSLGMLRLARHRAVGRVVQADATRLPLRSASLDGVWSLHALLHVPDLDAALGDVARILKPGAVAALTVALGEGVTVEPVPYAPDASRQFFHRTGEAVMQALAAAQLEVLDEGLDNDGRPTLWLLVRR